MLHTITVEDVCSHDNYNILVILRKKISIGPNGPELICYFTNNFCTTGCQLKTFKTFILMVKPLKPLFFSEKPLF